MTVVVGDGWMDDSFYRNIRVLDYFSWTPDLDVMDGIVWLANPPEYVLPEWDPIPPIDWTETHDWTNDYDYPDDWAYINEDEDYDY